MADNDWLALIQNLTKAREVWRIMSRILRREGDRPQVFVFLLKSVVQSVLLFGAETWVVTSHMGRVLRILQDQVAQQMTGRLPRRRSDGRWEYTLVEAAREEAAFEPMETYIRKIQNMVSQYYIAMRPILELCEATERKRGGWVDMWWWEQAELDLAGAREMSETAAETDEDGLDK